MKHYDIDDSGRTEAAFGWAAYLAILALAGAIVGLALWIA